LGSKPCFPELFQTGFLPDEDLTGILQILVTKVHFLFDCFDQFFQF